ncbi:hypothetical protein [Pendulispora albinea]|uniref:Uncharacterized protein n=1 Tax=Pendulispora albinea TaxID=2741071 RepID=A0ABZ2M9B4_9BACT
MKRLLAASWVAALVAGIFAVQPRLARTVHAIGEREDRYALPSPGVLRAATLGYRAAAADILWSKVTVEYGTHLAERRPFVHLTRYLDSILALEPDHAPVYRYGPSFILFHHPGTTERDAHMARHYLERGTRERPTDPEMWLRYGEFLSAFGPSFLASADEKTSWRNEGARAIARARELGAPGRVAPGR